MKIKNGERCYGIPHGDSVKRYYYYFSTHNWKYQINTSRFMHTQYSILRFSVWKSDLFKELFREV